ncbi:vacuolar protein sorting-associated protein 13A-like isoform X2 [Pomacea canaliculata]|uniref:vacuolar protein sorting-associated protein 13A-like isoform X2 n=1 Tax=Pomacea canaliculata TaxID=400727 RepID=UPI000D73F7B2|nr:vacuolar protein sorting-associated protein 13A-like isoform X2 [Pomacea canaliculata]
MVFESLVVDLINRFLGDFVENLDTSQLKIGIWGGSVVLDNLNIKESALDELDLPVKVKAGHISKLVLKIPWTNLYTEPVIAEIDGIYALAVPNIGVKYDAKKEEKILQDIKQKKLAQIEEAKKLEAERRQPKEVKKDTFAEKLTTQIVKNLQVKVNNIHVRYEDCYTNPARPFSFGITLQELLFQTTDEEWNPCIIKEAVTQIYKLVKLDSLSIYWNCYSNLLNQEESSVILDSLRSNIAGHGAKPEYQYVVRPISSVAHLRLHTKPEQKEFSIPKIGLTVVFDEIAIGLSKDQYDDILEMMESLERMTLLSVYRKYRPDKPLSGNTVLWWHYAYDSVLNETVRRRRQMWSWHHIAEHRKIMKTYREAYLIKLDKKLSAAVQKILDNSEKQLDVFNITLMRQQAEVQAAKQGAQRKESSSKSWFSGLFGKRKSSDSLEEEIKPGEMQEKFYELYTAEEKAKLYNAIGYEENEMTLVYPKEYEAVKVVTKFRNVAIFLRDRQSKDVHFLHRRETFFRQHQLLKLQLKDVYSYFGQRPAAGAIHLDAKIDRMVVSGTPQNDAAPRLITSQIQDAKEQIYSLANLSIATNPLDGLCDTRIRFKGRPLEIVYDAVTINKLAEFFKPPKSVELKQLSQAAMSKFDEIKEQSTAGIQHALQQHKYTDIGVDLMPSIIIVPEGGLMKNDVRKLILDLGQLTVVSSKHDTSIDPQLELAEKLKKAYDRFDIRLQRMQLLLANPGENWQLACTAGQSPQHVLSPMDILLDIRVCIFDKDPRMAKTKVHGVLPNLSLRISDKRVHEIMTLALSIPLPESAPVDEEPETEMFKGPSDLPASLTALSTSRIVNTAIIATAEHTDKERAPELRRLSSVEYTNMTDMELNFEIKEMVAVLSQRQGDTEIPVLKLMVESVGTEVQMRRFDMLVDAHIGTVYAQHLKYQLSNRINEELLSTGAVSSGPLINLVNTPSVGEDQKLLSVTFLQAKKTGPEFSTLYRNIEKNIQVNFSAVEILLHQRAILDLMELANSLVPPSTDDSQQSKNLSDDKAEAGSSLELWKEKEKGSKKRKEDPNLINLKVTVVLSKFSVGVCNDERLITNVQIKGICAEVAIQQARTTVSAILRETTVFDPDPHTRYHRILCIEGSNVLKAGAVVYNGGTAGNKYSDMSCFDTGVDVEIGCIKVFFVNKFISDLLGFMDNFQAAKDQMQKAGQVAAQVGMDTVQSLQETATRLLLKVNMKAPVIVVPQNSTSSNTLMLDFGQLSITNSFKLAGKLSPNNVPAILEEMNIVLTSLKLSRALMKGDTDISAECLILEPLTVSLQMRRNLSASWYHESPELELCGALEPLNVRLSQGDFGTMMQILNENLREGQPQASTKSNAVASSHSPETVVPSVSTTSKMLTEMEKHRPEVYVRIKVDVQLKGVIAVFYSGDTVLTSGICKREPSSSLGKFELVSMSAVAIIMSNDALKAKVSLNDLILDDLRLSKRTGITRMIERSKSGRNHSSDMVCVDFQQDAEKCLNVKISISSLYICVCVEFLMSLANFFTQGLGEISDSALKPKHGAMQSGLTPPVHSDQKQELQIMEVVLEMEKPEIILIEDQMNQSTKSLAVDLALSFRLIQTPEVQKINAGINGIQVFMCTFDSRHIPSHQILVPFDISVVSSAPYGQNHHVDVTFSDIVLVISPSILTTISLISRGLTPEGSKTSPLFLSTLASVPKWKVPANLWDVKTLASCNLWYIESAKQETKEQT